MPAVKTRETHARPVRQLVDDLTCIEAIGLGRTRSRHPVELKEIWALENPGKLLMFSCANRRRDFVDQMAPTRKKIRN